MRYLGFIWRVWRRMIWETATDETTGLAAQMAYLLLFALAPVLLFLWHLLGLFGTDPAKLHEMFVILQSFMPPDAKVQDILDTAMASVVLTGSSSLLANAGIVLGIYFGTVFIATISRALSHTHGVREDRHWWSKYIISFFMLFWFGIVILFCFNAIVFGEKLAGIAEVNFQLAVHRARAGLSRPRPVSPDTGKLSHRPPGVAGGNFLFHRLDSGDQALSILCRKIRSVQPDLSRVGVHHRPSYLDVSDLSAAASRGQIERHPPSRTRANAQRHAAGVCSCCARRVTQIRYKELCLTL